MLTLLAFEINMSTNYIFLNGGLVCHQFFMVLHGGLQGGSGAIADL